MWKLFEKQNKNKVISPCSGELTLLKDVNDVAFSSGELGDGFAVKFDGTNIYAPVGGIIKACFPGGHAIGIQTDKTEVIVHIGIDTVELHGECYEACVKQDDIVKQGDLLVKVKASDLIDKGYDPTTLVLFCSGEKVKLLSKLQHIEEKEEVAEYKAK